MNSVRTISPTTARRLYVKRQRLTGEPVEPTAHGILDVVRDLGCLQLDPISAVARSHTLVVFSRVGPYNPARLESLLYKDKQLFEYWAHAASIVLTEDYPIHHMRMRNYAKTNEPWHRRIREWIEQNKKLRSTILREITCHGPLPSRYFEEAGPAPKTWVSAGWTSGRNVSRMLDFLWMQGKIMVAGRTGVQKLWDLSERVLPDWTPRERLSDHDVVFRAAQKSLLALGVATPRHIERHYTYGRYPNLKSILPELERQKLVERVQVRDGDVPWQGTWYIHTRVLPELEKIERNEFEPRTTLLSPFDNLIIDRNRSEHFFDYKYRIEIYTPEAKRRYGYYVLSILHGDRIIGRVDPRMDRARGILDIKAIHAEPDAPRDLKTARAVRDAIEELGDFLGATGITYTHRVPGGWNRVLN